MQRILKLTSGDNTLSVPVVISDPHRELKSWMCKWEIRWPDRTRTNAAGGVDPLQALLHAMQMVGIELYMSEEHQAGRLYWNEPGEGFGFPLTRNSRDLFEGNDAEYL